MNISESDVIKRDEIVFRNAIKQGIPILMPLGRGYSKGSALGNGKIYREYY
jgi:hypothetical protein